MRGPSSAALCVLATLATLATLAAAPAAHGAFPGRPGAIVHEGVRPPAGVVYLRTPGGGAVRRLRARAGPLRTPPLAKADGLAPVIASGGGFGTFDRCHQRQTSDLMLTMDLASVLMLGDMQYPMPTRPASRRRSSRPGGG